MIAPEGSFVVSAVKCRGDIIAKIRIHCQNSVFFPIFPVSRIVPKTGVVFVAAAGGCLVK